MIRTAFSPSKLEVYPGNIPGITRVAASRMTKKERLCAGVAQHG